jgi:hypothetical protein
VVTLPHHRGSKDAGKGVATRLPTTAFRGADSLAHRDRRVAAPGRLHRCAALRPVPPLGTYAPAAPGRWWHRDLRPRRLPAPLRAACESPRTRHGASVADGDIRLPGRTNGGSAAVRTAIVLLTVAPRDLDASLTNAALRSSCSSTCASVRSWARFPCSPARIEDLARCWSSETTTVKALFRTRTGDPPYHRAKRRETRASAGQETKEIPQAGGIGRGRVTWHGRACPDLCSLSVPL